jgi:hypothetical protein
MDSKNLRFVAAGVLVAGAGAGLYLLTRPQKTDDKPAEAVDLKGDKPKKKSKEQLAAIARYKEMQRLRNEKEEAPKKEDPAQISKLRAIDRAILDRLAAPAPSARANDIFPRELAEVDLAVVTDNLTGKTEVRRVYIDLNRDGKNDEEWIVHGTEVTRTASPLPGAGGRVDHYKLEGDGWTLTEGTGLTAMQEPVAPTPPPPPIDLRDLDRQILGVVAAPANIQGRVARDITSGKPMRVQVFKNYNQTAVERVQIDFDRDDQWDEKWSVRGQEVSRAVSPKDDGKYSERYALKNGKWQRSL